MSEYWIKRCISGNLGNTSSDYISEGRNNQTISTTDTAQLIHNPPKGESQQEINKDKIGEYNHSNFENLMYLCHISH